MCKRNRSVKKISKIFWNDVFNSWTKVTEITSKKYIQFNLNMKMENSAISSKSYLRLVQFVLWIFLMKMDQLEFNLNIKTNFLEYNGQKGRREIAISIRPSFRGLLFHFYSTKLQFLVMFTINDIFHVILRVKGVLRYEH